MKEAHNTKQEQLAKGHGTYREVVQDEFLKEVACDDFCVVHFYHRDFEKCKVIDKHMPRLAHKHLETKFLKIDAEKCPFFVQKLQIRVLPCVIGFSNGIAKEDRIFGFEGLNEDMEEDKKDEWPTEALEARLGEMRVIRYSAPTEELEAELKEKGSIFGSLAGDDLGDFEDN
jgi:thioredoxin-like negative regulator of GroEL